MWGNCMKYIYYLLWNTNFAKVALKVSGSLHYSVVQVYSLQSYAHLVLKVVQSTMFGVLRQCWWPPTSYFWSSPLRFFPSCLKCLCLFIYLQILYCPETLKKNAVSLWWVIACLKYLLTAEQDLLEEQKPCPGLVGWGSGGEMLQHLCTSWYRSYDQ